MATTTTTTTSTTTTNSQDGSVPFAIATPIGGDTSICEVPANLLTALQQLQLQQKQQQEEGEEGKNTKTTTTTTTTRKTCGLSNVQIASLKQQGFPEGLAQEMGLLKTVFPIRFWAVDNSGSMWSDDGRSLRVAAASNKTNRCHVVPCTRWAELRGAVEYHINMAALLEAPTTFRLLNDPGVVCGPQQFSIAIADAAASTNNDYCDNKGSCSKEKQVPAMDTPSSHLIHEEIRMAEKVIRESQPAGATPLTRHLIEIRQQVESVATTLRSRGQKAVIVLATDGLPSDDASENSTQEDKEAFIQALKSLQHLPVWVVARICTKDEAVLNFYNNLDAMLEFPIDVLVDFFDEAGEVYQNNPWLNYGLAIHRCREMGYHNRLLDLLDERPLSKDETVEFLHLMFGKDRFTFAPDINHDLKGFMKHLSSIIKEEEEQFNPIRKKLEPWVNTKLLEKVFKPKSRRSFLRGRKRS